MAFVVAAISTADNQRIVHAVLAGAGHTVVLFGSGVPAVTEVRCGAPDVVIVDAQLADLSAAQICDAIRSDRSCAAIPIVVWSSATGFDVERLPRPAHEGAILVAPSLPSRLRVAVADAVRTGQGPQAPWAVVAPDGLVDHDTYPLPLPPGIASPGGLAWPRWVPVPSPHVETAILAALAALTAG